MTHPMFSEVLTVITQINELQKRFREAKAKHKDDLEELQIITEAVDFATRCVNYNLEHIRTLDKHEVDDIKAIRKNLSRIGQRAEMATNILEACGPKRTLTNPFAKIKYILNKPEVDKIKQVIYGIQSSLLMLVSFTQMKIRNSEASLEGDSAADLGPSTSSATKEAKSSVRDVRIQEAELREARKALEKATGMVRRMVWEEDEKRVQFKRKQKQKKNPDADKKSNSVPHGTTRSVPMVHSLPSDGCLSRRGSKQNSSSVSIENKRLAVQSPSHSATVVEERDEYANPSCTPHSTPTLSHKRSSNIQISQQVFPSTKAERNNIAEYIPNNNSSMPSAPQIIHPRRREAMAETLGLPILKAKASKKVEAIFSERTSFASVPFGPSLVGWTMLFFQDPKGWIQCGLVPSVDYLESGRDEILTGTILLEPIARAALGSPLYAERLDEWCGDKEIFRIDLFYTTQHNGSWILSDHHLDLDPDLLVNERRLSGLLGFSWRHGELAKLKLQISTSSTILSFGFTTERLICVKVPDKESGEKLGEETEEDSGGRLVFLEQDKSKDSWKIVAGPQAPPNMRNECPVNIKSTVLPAETSTEPPQRAHQFYFLSKEGYITRITYQDPITTETILSISKHTDKIDPEDEIQPLALECDDAALYFFRSTPNLILFETWDFSRPSPDTKNICRNGFRKKYGSRFHFSDSLNGMIYISDLGQLVLRQYKEQKYLETLTLDDYRNLSPMDHGKILFEEDFCSTTLNDMSIWLKTGWTLKHLVFVDTSCSDSEPDEESATNQEQIDSKKGPWLLKDHA